MQIEATTPTTPKITPTVVSATVKRGATVNNHPEITPKVGGNGAASEFSRVGVDDEVVEEDDDKERRKEVGTYWKRANELRLDPEKDSDDENEETPAMADSESEEKRQNRKNPKMKTMSRTLRGLLRLVSSLYVFFFICLIIVASKFDQVACHINYNSFIIQQASIQ